MTNPLPEDERPILVHPPGQLSSQGEAGEARKLGTLVDVSHALTGQLGLQGGLSAALQIMAQRCGVERGVIAVVGEQAGGLEILASLGTGYRMGEGTIREVIARGEAIVVARAGLGEQGTEYTLLAIPIYSGHRCIGALSIELVYRPERELERLLRFLRVVASMISQAMRIHRLLAAERNQPVAENAELRQDQQQRDQFPDLVGLSAPMRQLYEEVARVAGTSTTVLIRGESGTGKELIAQAIHERSPRAGKAFVKVNCAALPESLVESELFGHERGAFTGAEQRKKGRFELADGGTLFLDEVGELSPTMQVKLLRVLQEREFERVGGTESVRVDVRVIAATNRDLEKALAEASFREDLYYRLNVFPIFIPPLRARKADVLLLAEHFAEKYAREHGKQIKRISPSATDLLSSYHWPGNVRELENTMERAVLLADGEVIHGHHLPPTLQIADATGAVVSTLSGAVEVFERGLIEDALKTTRGNRSRAARLLGTTERVIGYKVRKYRIDPERLRE